MNRVTAKAFLLIDEGYPEVDLEALEQLLKELSGRWELGRDGESLLHAAVARGLKVVDLLLRYGAPVNEGLQEGVTPLHLACEIHEHATIELLLSRGADPACLTAAVGGSSCLNLLLDRPIKSPEQAAGSIRRLCSAGADPDLGNTATGDTPLIVLCSRSRLSWRGQLALVDLLIELGADIDRRNSVGYSPLMAAELGGKRYLKSCLRKHGAGEDGVSTARLHAALLGSRSLAVALWTRGRSNSKRALEAISNGADVNAPDLDGDVPLATALLHGDDALIEALISAGAKVDFGYGDCRTPLVAAAEAGRIEWVRRLLDQGADPECVTAYGRAWECAEDPEIRDLLRTQPRRTARASRKRRAIDLGLPGHDISTRFLVVGAAKEHVTSALAEALISDRLSGRYDQPISTVIESNVHGRPVRASGLETYWTVKSDDQSWTYVFLAAWPKDADPSSLLHRLARAVSKGLSKREVVVVENNDFRGFVVYARYRDESAVESLYWGELADWCLDEERSTLEKIPRSGDAQDEVHLFTSPGLPGISDEDRDPVEIVHDRLVELGVPAVPWSDRDLLLSADPRVLFRRGSGHHPQEADLVSVVSAHHP